MTSLEIVRHLLNGLLVMGCSVVGLFFLKYWRKSRDRLFAMFSVAFFVLALNWIALPFVPAEYESRELVYLIRLVAFVIILVAIVDKNRR